MWNLNRQGCTRLTLMPVARIYGADPINWTAGADLQRMNQRRAAYIAALKAADNHDIALLLAFVCAPKQAAS